MASGPKHAEAVTAFNRFGLGAGPGDLGAAAGDPRGFLLEELGTADVALIRDPALPLASRRSKPTISISSSFASRA
jgi:uncharacterized protein (DUF1800 family)